MYVCVLRTWSLFYDRAICVLSWLASNLQKERERDLVREMVATWMLNCILAFNGPRREKNVFRVCE